MAIRSIAWGAASLAIVLALDGVYPQQAAAQAKKKQPVDLLAEPLAPAPPAVKPAPRVVVRQDAQPRTPEVRKITPRPVIRTTPEMVAIGRGLFLREWPSLPPDANQKVGDGLGPLFNGKSCVECHSQGSIGGGGPVLKNVTLRRQSHFTEVIHRFGVSPKHANWRAVMLEQKIDASLPIGKPAPDRKLSDPVMYSERNATALFGVGLIDSIPDEVLLAVEKKSLEIFPDTTEFVDNQWQGKHGGGRLPRLEGHVLGRFGWKGQSASLREFTKAACVVELGVQPSDADQPTPEYEAWEGWGPDMSDVEFQGPVAFVASLPRPRQEILGKGQAVIDRGEIRFTQIGCADCHLPKLGDVEGIYSDLLLHDMGPELSGCGPDSLYGDRRPDPNERIFRCGTGRPQFATTDEWRTPPLWGCRDSAPYLHDGRAGSLEKAIVLHGGQGQQSATNYKNLSAEHKAELIAFLNSLAAPK